MKKQFFTTAIAFIAALSLSASAFAADGGSAAVGLSVGGSNIGSSTTQDVTLTDTVTTISGVINEELTVSAEVSKSLFPDYVSVSMDVSVADVAGEEAEDLKSEVSNVLKSYWHSSVAPVVNQAFDITFTGTKADGTVVANAQPAKGKSIKISFNTLDDSNAVFDPEGLLQSYAKALIGLARGTNKISSFRAPHFSTYYTVEVDKATANALLNGYDEEDETTTTPSTPGGGGSLVDPGTTTTTTAADTTTTPDSSNNNNNNNNNNNGGNTTTTTTTTQAPADNGNGNGGNGDVSDGGNNTGNTNGGAGNDKNQATGVVLAVVPAAAAAVAVIISKKRK